MSRVLAGALATLAVNIHVNVSHGQTTSRTAVATFGSGCFRCTEADFNKVPGVIETVSGHIGSRTAKRINDHAEGT